ncbi:hypothetical protein EVAR_41107_1 [Eumeta japonica]|uniref:Uncharacterized protein n=1 Tax=Eumeta variegata TaxID=151549 RepID=A0A4C1XBJ0_EUMVA|nr:hypothetical protein EVAR_41107_1 [Eumeta japonica]
MTSERRNGFLGRYIFTSAREAGPRRGARLGGCSAVGGRIYNRAPFRLRFDSLQIPRRQLRMGRFIFKNVLSGNARRLSSSHYAALRVGTNLLLLFLFLKNRLIFFFCLPAVGASFNPSTSRCRD